MTGNGEIKKILSISSALIENDHFVYKAGTHGSAYINKKKFSFLGARIITKMIKDVAYNAIKNGFNPERNMIGIIGPAMGTIAFSLTLANELESMINIYNNNKDVIFFPARTELIENSVGKKIHIIPEKLKEEYSRRPFIIFEDITNNGTTIREVKKLFEEKIGARIIAAMCFIDRGWQNERTLGVKEYYPLMRIDMTQYDVRKSSCPLCKKGIPINIILGKGRYWVNLFGQPPYLEEKDFSSFWK